MSGSVSGNREQNRSTKHTAAATVHREPHPTPWEWVQDSTDLRSDEARVLDADSALVGRFPALTARRIVYAVNDSAQELNDLMRVAFEQGQALRG